MDLTARSPRRLAFAEPHTARPRAGRIAAPVFLGLGLAFYVVDGGSAQLFGILFVLAGILFALLGVVRNPTRSLTLDRDRNEVRYVTPDGPGGWRRVQVMPLDALAGADLHRRGNAQVGYWTEISFMPKAGGAVPIVVRQGGTGPQVDAMHREIADWLGAPDTSPPLDSARPQAVSPAPIAGKP
jgi:hypothetical protein